MSRILWVNPVGNDTCDQPLAELFARIARPGNTVDVLSLGRGPATLEHRSYEALVAADLLGTVHQAEQDGYQALVVGCFHDPFLHAAREITDRLQITAPAEAALRTAATLGQRIAVLLTDRSLVPAMHGIAREYGVTDRIAAVRSIDVAVRELQGGAPAAAERMAQQAEAAIIEDGADVVVLGCSVAFGLHWNLQRRLGIPVVDPSVAAVKYAEHLLELADVCGWRHSKLGGYRGPPAELLDRLFPAPPDPATAHGRRHAPAASPVPSGE